MHLIIKQVPFPGLVFRHWHLDECEIGVCVVSGSFRIHEGSHARVLEDHPREVLLEDRFMGEPNRSCLLREQEIAPGKYATDVTVNAIPRIGQEVIVDFLEGDIDQPIITGRTYHAVNQPPYELPRHKTVMTIKSETHKGDGFNELRFEDENGQEEVFIHAQKDRNEKTLNNHTERIDNNWVQSVGNNKAIEINNNHNEVTDVTRF